MVNGPGVLELVSGFRSARVILSAVELGVFEMLENHPETAEDLAAKGGFDCRATEILLDALTSQGLLQKAAKSYSLSPAYRAQLSSNSPQSVLAMLWHSAHLWRTWSTLSTVVRQGVPQPDPDPHPDSTEHFIGAMRVAARSHAPEIASGMDLSGVRALLDLGGGPGTYAIEFARAWPALRAVVFDLPDVVKIAKRNIHTAGMDDRIETMAGSYLDDTIGGPYDLVWMSSIVHMHTAEENSALVRKVANALSPAGRLIIRDFLLNDEGTGPASAALFAVNMLVNTRGGRSYKGSQIREWMSDAGLTDVQVRTSDVDGLVIGAKQ